MCVGVGRRCVERDYTCVYMGNSAVVHLCVGAYRKIDGISVRCVCVCTCGLKDVRETLSDERCNELQLKAGRPT